MGRLSTGRTLDVLDQTGRALQVAHARSLVHRDIKPGNLLITPGGQVKITDFGIAKLAHQAPVTRTGLVMGTAQYISPEQATGHPAVPASDIYSLGVVAYECLAGRLPFPGENAVAMAMSHVRDTPGPLPPTCRPPVAALVMHMLVKDPAARFPNGAALAQAVGQLRSGRTPARAATARPAASPSPARPTAVRPTRHGCRDQRQCRRPEDQWRPDARQRVPRGRPVQRSSPVHCGRGGTARTTGQTGPPPIRYARPPVGGRWPAGLRTWAAGCSSSVTRTGLSVALALLVLARRAGVGPGSTSWSGPTWRGRVERAPAAATVDAGSGTPDDLGRIGLDDAELHAPPAAGPPTRDCAHPAMAHSNPGGVPPRTAQQSSDVIG